MTYPCSDCGASFPTWSALVAHRQNHFSLDEGRVINQPRSPVRVFVEQRGDAGTLAQRIRRVLDERGYLIEADGGYTLTPAGRSLQRIYGERDLLIAECLREGLWTELDAPTLAAALEAAAAEVDRLADQVVPVGAG